MLGISSFVLDWILISKHLFILYVKGFCKFKFSLCAFRNWDRLIPLCLSLLLKLYMVYILNIRRIWNKSYTIGSSRSFEWKSSLIFINDRRFHEKSSGSTQKNIYFWVFNYIWMLKVQNFIFHIKSSNENHGYPFNISSWQLCFLLQCGPRLNHHYINPPLDGDNM